MRIKNKIASYVLLMMTLFSMLVISCKKKSTVTPPQETGTVTDIDNNIYKTVKIGNQWWMAENLKVRTYRNGWPILQITGTDPDSSWANIKKGAYCEYFYKDDNAKLYGLLYNWYAISDTNHIAPVGWHVPSDDEWKELERNLGMSQANVDKVNWRGTDEGDKLKVASPYNWSAYGNVWSSNESGFSALAGSCRLFNGIWGDPGLGKIGFWWANTVHQNNNEAWYRYLDYKNSNVFRYYGSKNYGMSIRCVKD